MKLEAVLIVAAALALATGCASSPPFHSATEDVAMVPASGTVEFAIAECGSVTEVEYHITKEALPEKVKAAADEMFPGSIIVDAEKEYQGDELFYEVTKKKGAQEFEVMMTPKGKPYRMEIEAKPTEVPAEILAAADKAVPGGMRKKVEKILDGEENLLEYHIKKEVKGIKYKILVTTEGEVHAVYRETLAEIEIPLKF